MLYPKNIKIENNKLKELLEKKGDLITKGKAVTDEIIAFEKEMEEIDVKLQEEEKKVNIDDLLEKEKVISAKVDEAIKEMNAVKQEIFDRMNTQAPPELHTRYDELKKLKDDKENERNKIALKAQKFNDRIIPLGRELMKPFLEDVYEDYDSLYLDNGEVYATIFSHLNDFRTNFKKKQ